MINGRGQNENEEGELQGRENESDRPGSVFPSFLSKIQPSEAQITGFDSINWRALKHFLALSSLFPRISNTPW